MRINIEQYRICKHYKANFFETPAYLKVGISLNVKDGAFPLNGLRHPPEDDTSGWYIWAGENFSNDPDFFIPIHIEHLSEWNNNIIKYLALPPGYRFLIGENSYEDVWFDESLLLI